MFQAINIDGKEAGVIQMSALTAPLKDVLLRQISIYSTLSLVALLLGLLHSCPWSDIRSNRYHKWYI
ncbi:hypothetical protein KQR57_21865 [Bacillus inaquosorum]|nr:hypothetical protein [Bacillus inaquosorum]